MEDAPTPLPTTRVTEIEVPGASLTLEVHGDVPVARAVFTAGRDGAPPQLTVVYDLEDDAASPAAVFASVEAEIRRLDPQEIATAVAARSTSMSDDPAKITLDVIADLFKAAVAEAPGATP